VPTPAQVLAALLRSDPARPRVTFYDDAVNAGERIELSGKVLATWVSKAANLLSEELEIGPGDVVRLDLPAPHWRSLYWALAVWSVGATLDVRPAGPAQLLVTADPTRAADADAEAVVLVTLAGLARRHPDPVPDDVIDEARDLSSYGDRFEAWEEPSPDDDALVGDDGTLTYADVVPDLGWASGARVHVTGDQLSTLRHALAVWAVDGSVVLVLGPDAGRMPARLESEGVTLDLAGPTE
jgi:uncharacterized protein (TIGR03089 family)